MLHSLLAGILIFNTFTFKHFIKYLQKTTEVRANQRKYKSAMLLITYKLYGKETGRKMRVS